MTSIIALCGLLLFPSAGWAFVPHGYSGIHIHQMGHVFFAFSCVFIIWVIIRNRLHRERGWRLIVVAEVFFLAWNVDTFIGHITEFWIDPSRVIGSGEGMAYFSRRIMLEGREYLYYVTKLDHLLLIPAMLFFYAGLREHARKPGLSPAASAAVLPLMPILLVDIGGSIAMIVLSVLSLLTAVSLFRRNRDNPLWNYMLWLSLSYVAFSFSRSLGHILQHALKVQGYHGAWEIIDPFSGSFNSFTFVVIGAVSLFFFKAYESYLRISEDKRNIEAINADLTELNQEIETLVAERTMSMMALTVADKVRNPATVIGWTCRRILEKEEVSGKLEGQLRDIIGESEKLEVIVKDFGALLKSKKSMFRFEELNEIIRAVLPIVEKEAAFKGVSIKASLSQEPLHFNAQRNLLRAAIFHLVRNAIEATPQGGRISIATSGDRINVMLEVADTGPGIPGDELDKIFNLFYTTKIHRFGIGLPLVKQIVSEHLGDVAVESAEGKGTTFRLSFPVRWTEKAEESR